MVALRATDFVRLLQVFVQLGHRSALGPAFLTHRECGFSVTRSFNEPAVRAQDRAFSAGTGKQSWGHVVAVLKRARALEALVRQRPLSEISRSFLE